MRGRPGAPLGARLEDAAALGAATVEWRRLGARGARLAAVGGAWYNRRVIEERVKLTVEGYLAEVLALVAPLTDVVMEPAPRAVGRTLGEPVTSRGAVPAFANSGMDGFAVHAADLVPGAVLREVADLPAGSGDDPAVGPGECARIMTGAPVPTATDTVLPRELVTETPAGIVVNEVVPAGANVRHAGEDLAPGDAVLPVGHVLDARALSLVAACGRDEVAVVRRPIVNVASTGDELSPPGRDLDRGQIYESNSVFLAEAARRDGAEVLATAVLPDDPDAFAAGLDALARFADLVVLSGGVSVGDYDVVRQVLTQRGEAAFRHVHMQPGKPQGWARWRTPEGRTVPVLALPGNPLSAAVSYELFVRPALDRFLGRPSPGWTAAVVDDAWRSHPGRRQFVPVVIEVGADGVRRVRRAHRRGSASHMVSALALADALAAVPEDTIEVAPGQVLLIRPLT
nr:molybdopterin molybdotransferase MoeA [Propionibacterium sp.]